MAEVLLRLQGLEKSYGGNKVLNGLTLNVHAGEFVTLLGPSGCGKTTTLRIIAGLLQQDAGTVELAGQDITRLPPEKRNVNTVFQNYALFPHMNVEKNIAYGLKLRGVSKEERRQRVQQMLNLVQLQGFEKRMPAQLSGGQRQRVAIARAVVLGASLLLLDEPLGALDQKLRQQMQLELKEIQKKLGIAFVYITHDQEEALNMSDRIAVMNNGVLEQVGTPEEIYERPRTAFVASFIGLSSFLNCLVKKVDENSLILSYGNALFPARRDGLDVQPGRQVRLCLRAERLSVHAKPMGECCLQGVLSSVRYAGGSMRAVVQLQQGGEVAVQCPSVAALNVQPGQQAYLCWNPGEAAVVAENNV